MEGVGCCDGSSNGFMMLTRFVLLVTVVSLAYCQEPG